MAVVDKEILIRILKKGEAYSVIEECLVYRRRDSHNRASINPKRMLGNVLCFYRKYFFEMSFIYHLRMIKKIGRLLFESYRKL